MKNKMLLSHSSSLRWGISIVSAWLASVFLFTDRCADVTHTEALLNSFHGDRLTMTLSILLLTFLFRSVYTEKQKRAVKFARIGAAVFTAAYHLGYNLFELDSLTRKYVNPFSITADFLCILGSFLLFYGILVCFFDYLLKNHVQADSYSKKWFGYNSRSFWICFCIPMTVSTLALIILYPGFTSPDSFVQIAEALGLLPLSDKHPFMHTLIIRLCIRLGSRIFGNIAAGVAVFTLVQCILTSLTAACALMLMAKWRVRTSIRIAALLYFSLHPSLICYSITIWKDIWLSCFLLLYILLLIDMVIDPDAFFKRKTTVPALILVTLGFLFSKNTGILVFLGTMPFLFIYEKKYWKPLLVVCSVCLAVLTLVRFIIIPQCGIIQGDVREILSIPLQQVARTCAKSPENLTESQVDRISEVLPYDRLSELYDATLADPVKQTFQENVFTSDPGKYIRCWLEIGTANPRIYLEAFLANSCGYWYPDIVYWQISPTGYFDGPLTDDSWGFTDPHTNTYARRNTDPILRHYLVHLYTLMQSLPGLSTVMGAGFYFWAQLLLVLIALMKKRYRLLLPMLVVWIIWITCILSPVIAEFRYAFPAVVSLPLLAAFTFQDELSPAG